jgi:hypothetical protein
MSAPFEPLRERLLRAGIAPRHVRRYLRELTEHLADLTAEQRAAGYDDDNAAIRARALLGDDAELAAAMEEQPGFRSIAARFPWLMFGVIPPLVMFICTAFPVLLVAIFAKLTVILSLIERGTLEPAWLKAAIRLILETGNLLALPLAVLLMTIIVWRQRLSPAWLLLSLAVLWPLLLNAGIDFPATAEMARKSGASLSLGAGFSTRGSFAQPNSLLFTATHYSLALIPVACLLWKRRNALAKSFAAN